MKNVIESMELKLHDENWNEVKLAEYHEGRRTEHTYHSVAKKTVMKLLNSSKTPSISDFEAWIKEDDARQKAKHGNDNRCIDAIMNWWTAN